MFILFYFIRVPVPNDYSRAGHWKYEKSCENKQIQSFLLNEMEPINGF